MIASAGKCCCDLCRLVMLGILESWGYPIMVPAGVTMKSGLAPV